MGPNPLLLLPDAERTLRSAPPNFATGVQETKQFSQPGPNSFCRKAQPTLFQFLPPAQPGDVLVPHLGISAKLPGADHGGVLGDGPISRRG